MFFILCLFKSENRFIRDGDIVEGDIKVLPGQSRGLVPSRLWEKAEFVYDIESSLGKKRITHYRVQVPNQVNIWRRREGESFHIVKSIWTDEWSRGEKPDLLDLVHRRKLSIARSSRRRLNYQRNKIKKLTSWGSVSPSLKLWQRTFHSAPYSFFGN